MTLVSKDEGVIPQLLAITMYCHMDREELLALISEIHTVYIYIHTNKC